MRDPFNRPPLAVTDGIPVFTAPSPYISNYDLIASVHLESLRVSGRSPFMTDSQIDESLAATLDLARPLVADGSCVLDAGVGCGQLLAREPRLERHGVDISIEYLRIAQSRGYSVAMAELSDLPHASGAFDAVFACDVLEHLIDIDKSVAELRRVLRPGGVLVVRVPNEECLDQYLDPTAFEFAHVRTFSESSLRLYLEKCHGFRWIERRFCAAGFYTASQLRHPAPGSKSGCREAIERERAIAMDPSAQRALDCLLSAASWSLQEQVDALITLRDGSPETFARLADMLVRPAGLVAALRRT